LPVDGAADLSMLVVRAKPLPAVPTLIHSLDELPESGKAKVQLWSAGGFDKAHDRIAIVLPPPAPTGATPLLQQKVTFQTTADLKDALVEKFNLTPDSFEVTWDTTGVNDMRNGFQVMRMHLQKPDPGAAGAELPADFPKKSFVKIMTSFADFIPSGQAGGGKGKKGKKKSNTRAWSKADLRQQSLNKYMKHRSKKKPVNRSNQNRSKSSIRTKRYR